MASVSVVRKNGLDYPLSAGQKIVRYLGLTDTYARAAAHDLYESGSFRQVFVKSDAGGYLDIFPQPMA